MDDNRLARVGQVTVGSSELQVIVPTCVEATNYVHVRYVEASNVQVEARLQRGHSSGTHSLAPSELDWHRLIH